MSEIDTTELASRLADVVVVDVRRADEYDGSFGAPCDPRQGHLPGAVNIDVHDLMLLSPGEVEARLGVAPGAEVVAYCHSGSRSAHAVMILGSLGYAARNYVGSWHEWSRTELPIETE